MRSAGGKPPDLSRSHRCQPACVSVRITGGDAKALFACRGAGCPAGIRRNESFIVDRAECSITDGESAVISDNFFVNLLRIHNQPVVQLSEVCFKITKLP